MSTDEFFEEARAQSIAKTTIVSKYFWVWAKVITFAGKKRAERIAYIDLFAGPGRYQDGTASTPLRVLQTAIKDSGLRERLVSVFNDKDNKTAQTLEDAIASLPGVDTLRYRPKVYHGEVGEEITRLFEGIHLVPTLLFVDPWGYKGVSLALIGSVLKDWGCDCIVFFNYNRINPGLNNPAVKDHMDALFGEDRANRLRQRLTLLDSKERQLAIVEEICDALREAGGKYVLPFCFKNERGSRTSHHLVFVSKNFKGYEIMKDVMARESSSATQGVPTFSYNPADARYPTLFELWRPLDELAGTLLDEFAGKRLTMRHIYEQHSVGRPYLKKNYKEVLRKLERDGKIKGDPPAEERPRRKGEATFADGVWVTFPRRGK